MHNDSIETLLLRHYGRSASAPAGLEQQLVASLHHQEAEQRWQQGVATRLRERRISRRRVVGLVALTSVSAGILSVGVESLRMVESALVGQRQDAVHAP
jgi:hypothetical protein